MRTVPVPITLLHALVEAAKRVGPRGAEDGDHLHRIVVMGERLLGQQGTEAA